MGEAALAVARQVVAVPEAVGSGSEIVKKSEIQGTSEDLEDIVGIATRMMQDEEGKLTAEEIREIGEELDIPPEYVDRARKELEKKRALEKREQRDEVARNKTMRLAAGIFAVGAVIFVFLGTLNAQGSLRDANAIVEKSRAQVENVTARQKDVQKQYGTKGDTADARAEITGAANRIRVETKRLNDAVARYNAEAGGVFGRLATLLSSLPRSQ